MCGTFSGTSVDNADSLDLDQLTVAVATDSTRTLMAIADVDARVAAATALDQRAALNTSHSGRRPGHAYTPGNVDIAQVRKTMCAVEGVKDVHDLHVWSLTSGVNALSAHVVRDTASAHEDVLSRRRETRSSCSRMPRLCLWRARWSTTSRTIVAMAAATWTRVTNRFTTRSYPTEVRTRWRDRVPRGPSPRT